MWKNKPEILILGTLPPPLHGASLYFQNLIASGLLRQAYRVHFLNLNLQNRLDTYHRFTVLKTLRALRYLAAYLSLLSRKNIDLIYAQIAFPKFPFLKDSLFVIAARLFRKRIIGSIVGLGLRTNYDAASWPMKGYYRWIGGLYTAFISPGLKMSRQDFLGIFPLHHLEVIPFGTVPDQADPPGVLKPQPVHHILYMSHFIPSKGIFDALRAVKQVCRRQGNVKFLFAGEWLNPEDRERGLRILENDGVREQVEFVGSIEGRKKQEIMTRAEIFILPSYYEYEGLPLAILEAMSYGHCLIATDHAAIGEVLKHGVNGYVCQKRNPEDLGEKILYGLEHQEETMRIRRTNQETYYRLYTHRAYMERLIEALGKYGSRTQGSG